MTTEDKQIFTSLKEQHMFTVMKDFKDQYNSNLRYPRRVGPYRTTLEQAIAGAKKHGGYVMRGLKVVWVKDELAF